MSDSTKFLAVFCTHLCCQAEKGVCTDVCAPDGTLRLICISVIRQSAQIYFVQLAPAILHQSTILAVHVLMKLDMLCMHACLVKEGGIVVIRKFCCSGVKSFLDLLYSLSETAVV